MCCLSKNKILEGQDGYYLYGEIIETFWCYDFNSGYYQTGQKNQSQYAERKILKSDNRKYGIYQKADYQY